MLSAAGCLVLALTGFLIWRHRGGDAEGVELQSTKMHPLPEAVYYLQKDERWASDPLGDSRFTMGSSGCLVTCLAALFNLYGESVTPGELNRLFTEQGVYNVSGDVIWENIASVYPEATVTVYQTVDEKAIETALDQQQYPLVRVKNMGDGYWHWVLLLGSGEEGYLCMDPLYNDKEARPLSVHGNTVYSWRLVTQLVKEYREDITANSSFSGGGAIYQVVGMKLLYDEKTKNAYDIALMK